VTAGAGCAWTAVSNAGWITVTSGASGTGNGTVGYSVAANGGSDQRQGTVTIAGQTFTVTQAGTSGGAGPSVNTGQLWQMKDWITGEEVTYSYDELGRLAAAQTTGPEWGQSFGYDGFGNLVSQTVTKGTAPALSVLADPATNRIVGASYDANGNLLGGRVQL
jgi:YD repeat-containing protein